MEIICIEDYHMGENTYVVGEGSAAFAVDPGTDADKIVKRAAEHGFKITDILLTMTIYAEFKSCVMQREQDYGRVRKQTI